MAGTTWPHFCDIERIERSGCCLFGSHDLVLCMPSGMISSLDSMPQIAFGIIWIDSAHLLGFFCSKLLLSMLGEKVIFDIMNITFLIDPDDVKIEGIDGADHLKV